MFVYSIVRFIPDLFAQEQVNIGFFIGNDDKFIGRWLPERARMFGVSVERSLAAWLEFIPPLEIVKLIRISEDSWAKSFRVETPRLIGLSEDLTVCADWLESQLFPPVEKYANKFPIVL